MKHRLSPVFLHARRLGEASTLKHRVLNGAHHQQKECLLAHLPASQTIDKENREWICEVTSRLG